MITLPVGGKDAAEWRRNLLLDAVCLQFHARVMAAVVIGTLWTVPFGVWIGLNPRLSDRLQPLINSSLTSFPSPHDLSRGFLPSVLIVGCWNWLRIGRDPAQIPVRDPVVHILFNVAGAAAAIPNDIISCATILRLSGWTVGRNSLFPAILPGLGHRLDHRARGRRRGTSTIVSEILTVNKHEYVATGLSAYIARDQRTPRISPRSPPHAARS